MSSELTLPFLAFWGIIGLFGFALLWAAYIIYMDRKRTGGDSFKRIIRLMFMLD